MKLREGIRVIRGRYGDGPLTSYTPGTDLSGTLEAAGGIGGLLARAALSTINSPL